jgi:hypothetical protein
MDIIIDKTKIPHREWRWNENEIGYEGVRTYGSGLKWFTFRKQHNGDILGVEQRYEDYIKDGPLKENLPAEIMLDIYDIIMSAVQTDNLF